jgi:hypothetical protein
MRICRLRDRACAPAKGVLWKSQTRPRLRYIPIATSGGPPPGPLAIHGFVCPLHSGNLRCTSGFLGPVPDCLCAPQDENSSSAAITFEQIRSERTKSRLRTGSPCPSAFLELMRISCFLLIRASSPIHQPCPRTTVCADVMLVGSPSRAGVPTINSTAVASQGIQHTQPLNSMGSASLCAYYLVICTRH